MLPTGSSWSSRKYTYREWNINDALEFDGLHRPKVKIADSFRIRTLSLESILIFDKMHFNYRIMGKSNNTFVYLLLISENVVKII